MNSEIELLQPSQQQLTAETVSSYLRLPALFYGTLFVLYSLPLWPLLIAELHFNLIVVLLLLLLLSPRDDCTKVLIAASAAGYC